MPTDFLPVDSGLLAALILAGGITAVVALGMAIVKAYRASRLTTARGALSVSLGVGILLLSGLGIVALSPIAAQAATVSPTTHAPTSAVDIQLPTE